MPTTYSDCKKTLQTAKRLEAGKPVANHTRLNQRGDDVAVTLHQTDVVTHHKDGSFTLDSGGWKTVTTKERINTYSPVRLSSVKGVWLVTWPCGGWDHNQRKYVGGKTYVFQDGMRCYPSGRVTGAKLFTPKASAKEAKQRARVAKYAKKFVEALYAGKIGAPSGGDCWSCLLRVEAPAKDKGKTMGEAFTDRGHIESHIQENYFVPSLLYRALEVMGSSIAAKGAVHELTHPGQQEPGWSKMDFLKTQIEKCLRRYVLRQLGMAS